jgi:hypothetical protein
MKLFKLRIADAAIYISKVKLLINPKGIELKDLT